MPLKHGTINPLNACGVRRTVLPAAHFAITVIPKYSLSFVNRVDMWIFQNLSGRYYIGQTLVMSDTSMVFGTKIGFESEKELSFFKLAFAEA
jgi:hypothetical protein